MLSSLLDSMYEGLLLPFSYLISPEKRIHVLYLSSSLIMALYIYLKTKPNASFFKYLFPKKIWTNPSARVDYLLFFINGFFKVLFIAPIAILGITMQETITALLNELFGVCDLNLSRSTIVFSYTLVLWLFGDFASFYVHYLMHKIPFLWRFHKIHHAATVLNPITLYRIHPGELILNNVKTIIVFGTTTGIFYYLANGKVGIMGFLGVNVFRFFFLLVGSNLRHSHVKLKFPLWLEHILISPYQHQVHHSDNQQHYNKNIGSHLAIWDWLFGTLITSKKVKKIKFGLGAAENAVHENVIQNLVSPFKGKRNKPTDEPVK